MRTAVVYWIKSKTHSNPFKEGYIGVSVNPKRRWNNHKRNLRIQKHHPQMIESWDAETLEFVIVFEGSETDCYAKEAEFRPSLNIGWNKIRGGQGVTFLDWIHSDEFRAVRSKHMQGNTRAAGNHKPKTLEHRQKIGAAHKGRIVSEEQRRKQSLAMTGRKLTPEHKAKIVRRR
jgi:hypothetical protein